MFFDRRSASSVDRLPCDFVALANRKRGRVKRCWMVLATLAALTVALPIGVASSAAAQTPICRQLMSQAKENSSSSKVSSLKLELARTMSQADRRGCFRGFFRPRGNGCGPLLGRIERLEHKIHQATERPRRHGSIKRELARNGCLEQPLTEAEVVDTTTETSSDGYRTVCVRVCDGYFFPMGFAQSKNEFARDRDGCKGIYRGAEADLFFYPSDGSPEQMISVKGQAYAKQSFAFAYQREFRPACQSQLQQGLRLQRDAALATASKEAFKSSKLIPTPVPRPDLAKLARSSAPAEAAKVVSRVLPNVPFYATAPAAADLQETAAQQVTEKGPSILKAILEFIAPVAKAEPQRLHVDVAGRP